MTVLRVAPRALADLLDEADAADAQSRARYFGAAPGGYAEGDVHLGVRVPVLRRLARRYRDQTTFTDLDVLVASEYHEARLLACLLAVERFKRADDAEAERLVAWSVGAVPALDNWDLVDSRAPYVLGEWVLAHPEESQRLDVLMNSDNPWARRFAVVATQALIRGQVLEPTFGLAARAVRDPSVWVHKAAGWMLREAGQRDRARLDAFLREHRAAMPRVMLRAAIAAHDAEARAEHLAR